MIPEAFVYCWTDHATNKLYIGSHKGDLTDGYICSSKIMLDQYNSRPKDFTRQIIAHGTYADIRCLETKILEAVNAALNENFYNKHNASEKFFNQGHDEKTKQKISKSLKGRLQSKEHVEKVKKSLTGRKFSDSHIENMKKNHWTKRDDAEILMKKFKESLKRK